jgi:hypothetical protein
MFRPAEDSVSHSNPSMMATCEQMNFMLSSTFIQSIHWSGEPRESDSSSLVASGPVAPEESGAGITSSMVALPGIPRRAPRTSRSWGRHPTSSPSRGHAPSTSTLTMPTDAPSALGSSRTRESFKRVELLPSYTAITGTSVPWGIATGHSELDGTVPRS